MNGICTLSLIPVRSEPSGKSELVTQLLFGEDYEVIREENEWLEIRNTADAYIGWINRKQFEQQKAKSPGLVIREFPCLVCNSEELGPRYLVPGSRVDAEKNTDGFSVNGHHFSSAGFHKNAAQGDALSYAMKFLGVPYLWGGKSPFGIDCSGLVQLAFLCAGMQLKRDTWQQAEQGESVAFVEETRAGDLAFFDNENGRIIHVGMLTGNGTILHASGEVRIDAFDSHGIFNRQTQKYSHKLRLIRRIIT